MRAILKLIAVSGVVGLFALDPGPEAAIAGAVLLVVVAFAIAKLDRNKRLLSRVTQRVLPIAEAQARGFEDVEGKTVRATMTAETAYQMHQQYAPSFDQQLAINRHLERHGDEHYVPAGPANDPYYDPRAYQEAQERAAGFDAESNTATDDYVRLFDEQLAVYHRKTKAYEVPQPARIARGSRSGQLATPDEESQAPSQRRSQEGPAMVRPTARRV